MRRRTPRHREPERRRTVYTPAGRTRSPHRGPGYGTILIAVLLVGAAVLWTAAEDPPAIGEWFGDPPVDRWGQPLTPESTSNVEVGAPVGDDPAAERSTAATEPTTAPRAVVGMPPMAALGRGRQKPNAGISTPVNSCDFLREAPDVGQTLRVVALDVPPHEANRLGAKLVVNDTTLGVFENEAVYALQAGSELPIPPAMEIASGTLHIFRCMSGGMEEYGSWSFTATDGTVKVRGLKRRALGRAPFKATFAWQTP